MFALALSVLLAHAAMAMDADSTVPSLDSLAMSIQMEKEPPPLILDLRAKAEFESGHIPGAVNVPWGSPAEQKRGQGRLGTLVENSPSVILYGRPALELIALAAHLQRDRDISAAVYPAGSDGWTRYSSGYLNVHWSGLWHLLTTARPLVLDLRTPEAYAREHIPGAHRVSSIDASALASMSFWDDVVGGERPVVVYCDGSARAEGSRLAAQLAEYTEAVVYHFEAGFQEWKARTRHLRDAQSAPEASLR
jgi:rhodanese-related sulfurtransferase